MYSHLPTRSKLVSFYLFHVQAVNLYCLLYFKEGFTPGFVFPVNRMIDMLLYSAVHFCHIHTKRERQGWISTPEGWGDGGSQRSMLEEEKVEVCWGRQRHLWRALE